MNIVIIKILKIYSWLPSISTSYMFSVPCQKKYMFSVHNTSNKNISHERNLCETKKKKKNHIQQANF